MFSTLSPQFKITTPKTAPQPAPNMPAHSAPLSVLFVVVLCGSVESVLPSELFKLFFHRCLYDFLGQLPFEWEITKCTPDRHATACVEHTLCGNALHSNRNINPNIVRGLFTLNIDTGWIQMSRNVKYISTICIFQRVGLCVSSRECVYTCWHTCMWCISTVLINALIKNILLDLLTIQLR